MHGKIGLRNELEKGNIKKEHVEYEIEMQFKFQVRHYCWIHSLSSCLLILFQRDQY